MLTWLTHLVGNLTEPFPRVGKDGEEADSHRDAPTSAGSDMGLGMEVGIVRLQHEIAMVSVNYLDVINYACTLWSCLDHMQRARDEYVPSLTVARCQQSVCTLGASSHALL